MGKEKPPITMSEILAHMDVFAIENPPKEFLVALSPEHRKAIDARLDAQMMEMEQKINDYLLESMENQMHHHF